MLPDSIGITQTSRSEGREPSTPARVILTTPTRSLHARQLTLAALLLLRLAHRAALQRLLQTQTRDVQAALDRADRRLELAGHLLQSATANVERYQRRPIRRL